MKGKIRQKGWGKELTATFNANLLFALLLCKFRASNVGTNKIITSLPTLPDFALALSPEDYELPQSDPLWKRGNDKSHHPLNEGKKVFTLKKIINYLGPIQ
jgi:hypothetical protein